VKSERLEVAAIEPVANPVESIIRGDSFVVSGEIKGTDARPATRTSARAR